VTAAKSGENTAHVAQRATTQAIAALTAQLKDAGVAVFGEPSYDEKVVRRLEHLRHDGQPLTADTHAACPGHAAYVKKSWGEQKAEVVYVCVHPRLRGHTDLTRPTPDAERPTTDEQKAERRRVRANNDAWRSAEKVRRDRLRDFLTCRTLPKGAAAFLATVLIHDCHALGELDRLGQPPASRRAASGHHTWVLSRVSWSHRWAHVGHCRCTTCAVLLRRYCQCRAQFRFCRHSAQVAPWSQLGHASQARRAISAKGSSGIGTTAALLQDS
jgi:hypothetical protein